MSVNWIIRLLLSLLCWPKVILLTGEHWTCITLKYLIHFSCFHIIPHKNYQFAKIFSFCFVRSIDWNLVSFLRGRWRKKKKQKISFSKIYFIFVLICLLWVRLFRYVTLYFKYSKPSLFVAHVTKLSVSPTNLCIV